MAGAREDILEFKTERRARRQRSMVCRSRDDGRLDAPRSGDAWDGCEREPVPDLDGTPPEWLWSRGLPDSVMEHSVHGEALDVLDAFDWRVFPRSVETLEGEGGEHVGVLDVVAEEFGKIRASRLGASIRGVNHPKALLCPESVAEIRALARDGAPYWLIGEQFGVSDRTARAAATGETWGHLPGAVGPRWKRGESSDGSAG